MSVCMYVHIFDTNYFRNLRELEGCFLLGAYKDSQWEPNGYVTDDVIVVTS